MLVRVYYLDDEVELCENFHEIFNIAPVLVRPFSEVAEFLKAVELHPPDIVVLDYRLLKTTGDLVADQLSAHLPKILVTGDLNIETMNIFLHVFEKPYDLEQMRRLLLKHVK